MGRKGVEKRKSSKKNVGDGSKNGAVSTPARAAEPVVTQSIGRGEAISSHKKGSKK